MNFIGNFWRSQVGKKIVMAVTGLIGVGFVVAHMAGNLQVFVGREKMNAYAAFLHGPAAELLWIARGHGSLLASQLSTERGAKRPNTRASVAISSSSS